MYPNRRGGWGFPIPSYLFLKSESLFHHDDFTGGAVFPCIHLVEIDSAADRQTVVSSAIPGHTVKTAGFGSVYQSAHQLAFDVVDPEGYRAAVLDAIIDHGLSSEGIGIN